MKFFVMNGAGIVSRIAQVVLNIFTAWMSTIATCVLRESRIYTVIKQTKTIYIYYNIIICTAV